MIVVLGTHHAALNTVAIEGAINFISANDTALVKGENDEHIAHEVLDLKKRDNRFRKPLVREGDSRVMAVIAHIGDVEGKVRHRIVLNVRSESRRVYEMSVAPSGIVLDIQKANKRIVLPSVLAAPRTRKTISRIVFEIGLPGMAGVFEQIADMFRVDVLVSIAAHALQISRDQRDIVCL